MKRIFSVVLFFGLTFSLVAQRPSGAPTGQRPNLPKINLSGSVVDKETGEPLEYTTISLVNERFPERVQGGITAADGSFNVEVVPGNYNITIEYIGFDKITLSNRNLSANENLGKIELEINAESLQEVEVTAERTEVEIRLDKRIYNVGKDLTVRGGSVADVLDNVPSVSVDVEGNVSLRGNDNVRILINGKPSGLVGISGPQGLRSLPAESIEKVEVVTSPSARYDAEGTAGILNIILKKNQLEGINGTLIANGGLPETYGGSVNLNWRTRKVNIFTTNTLRVSTSKGNSLNDTEFFNGADPSAFLYEKAQRTRTNGNKFTNLGIEYYFNDKTSLTLSGFYRNSDNSNLNENELKELDALDAVLTFSERIEFEDEKDVSQQFSANFFKDFETEGERLTATFQYELSTEDEFGDISSISRTPISATNYEITTNIEDQKEILGQVDYVLPINKDTQFEIGYRGNFRTQSTDYSLEYLRPTGYELDTNLSNVLVYKEYVNAAYTQYGKKIDKFSFLAGMRMENSNITIDQQTTNDVKVKKYTDWFPTANLSYELSERTSFTLGYSRRIRRPRSRFINPFPSRSSVTNIFQGNPDLDPTYSNAFDFGYLKRWDKFTLNGSVYYQKATKVFTFISENTGETAVISGDINDPNSAIVELPVIKRFPINLAENIRWGTEFSLAYFPSRKLRFNGNFNLFNSTLIGEYNGTDFGAKNISWFARFNSTIKLPGEIDWQMRAFYRGPFVNAQSTSQGSIFVSGALNKEILKKKGTLSFRVNDLFNSSRRISETLTETFFSYSEFQWRQPSYVLSLSYRINEKLKDRRRSRRQGFDGGGGDDDSFDF